MKLTNYHRESFVRSVMNDVPLVKITKDEIQERLYKAMHPRIKGIYKDEALRNALRAETVFVAGNSYYGLIAGNADITIVLKDVNEAADARVAMRKKLGAISSGCSTLKQLKERLPELHKHMPSDEPGVTAGVPMVIDLMSDLKKLGFVA